MLKPKIKKVGSRWQLKYYTYPRHFSIFGMSIKEREEVFDRSFFFDTYDSFDQALIYLKNAYKNNLVRIY